MSRSVRQLWGWLLRRLRTLVVGGALSLALSAPVSAGSYLFTPSPLDENAFVFGGAIFRNEAADLREATIYGAALSVIADPLAARVFPPGRGRAGGADGGALIALPNESHDMFFHPTGVQPGAVLVLGETASVAGQVAPTLPADVRVTITSPSGLVREFSAQANAVGAYFDPAGSLVVRQPFR